MFVGDYSLSPIAQEIKGEVEGVDRDQIRKAICPAKN